MFSSKSKSSLFLASMLTTASMSAFAMNSGNSEQNHHVLPQYEGKAVIYVYRDEPFYGDSKIALEINGEYQGHTVGDSYVKKVVNPGPVSILSHSENLAQLKLDVEANKHYFIRKNINAGRYVERAYLDIVEEQVGIEALNKISSLN